MADVKITDLDPADALTGVEVFELVQDGENKRASIDQVLDYVASEVGGGGGGTVDTVTGTDGVAVDSTDPANPIAKLSGIVPGRATSSTAFTLALSDRGQFIETTGAAPVITIPTEASADLGAGATISGMHLGTGELTFSVAGITLRFVSALTNAVPQYAAWQLVKSRSAANTWLLFGYMEAA